MFASPPPTHTKSKKYQVTQLRGIFHILEEFNKIQRIFNKMQIVLTSIEITVYTLLKKTSIVMALNERKMLTPTVTDNKRHLFKVACM